MAKYDYRSLASKNPKMGESAVPIAGGYEYTGPGASKAGAGRGGQGGPNSEQANKEPMGATERAIREELEFDKMSRVRPEQKYAAGGSASSRADGCITKGHTRGRMV
jgi:hypothetical protein